MGGGEGDMKCYPVTVNHDHYITEQISNKVQRNGMLISQPILGNAAIKQGISHAFDVPLVGEDLGKRPINSTNYFLLF